jgi:type IV pilus biogenesis/stability protein PilW
MTKRFFIAHLALAAVTVFMAAAVSCGGVNGDGGIDTRIDADTYYKLGLSKLNEQNFQGAAVEFNKAVKVNPNHKDALNSLGQLYIRFEDFSKAVEFFQRAVNVSPNFSEAYNNLGITYAKMGLWEKSIEVFNTALKNPFYDNPAIVYKNLGFSLYRLGRYEEAVKEFKNSIRRQPNMVQAYMGLALSYNATRQYGNASEYLMTAVQLDSQYKGDISKVRKDLENSMRSTTGSELKDLKDYLEILNY